jgi:hypothetical protein
MAHYANISSQNKVTAVFVGIDEDNTTDLPEGFSSWEEWYSNHNGCTVKRTSYNTFEGVHNNGGTAFRGNYAGPGYIYNTENDVFILPQPADSWTLNTTTWTWEAPIALPDTTNVYVWDEEWYQSDNTKGWRMTEQISE